MSDERPEEERLRRRRRSVAPTEADAETPARRDLGATRRRGPGPTGGKPRGKAARPQPRDGDKKAPRPDRRRPGAGIARAVRHRAFPWTLAVLFLALAVTFAVLWLGARGVDDREPEVLATSRRFLEALTNFSGDTIEQDVQQIRSFGVGQFSEELEETFSDSFIADLKENQGVSVGEIESVYVQSLDGSTATVFGVVTQTLDNASLAAPRVEVLRAEIQLIETPDGWRVNSVSALQSPGSGTFG